MSVSARFSEVSNYNSVLSISPSSSLSFCLMQFDIVFMHLCIAAAAAAKSLQACLTLCDPIEGQPTRLPHPWESPGENTGVGCHFLLQCMKVKSESEVAQLCPTLCDPMDCSLPGFSIHGIFQARVLEWGAIDLYIKECYIFFEN